MKQIDICLSVRVAAIICLFLVVATALTAFDFEDPKEYYEDELDAEYIYDVLSINTRLNASERNIVNVSENDIQNTSENLTKTVIEVPLESSKFTKDEIDLIALVTMAEAEGESDLGKRLVVDVILNRLDHPSFPDTIYDIIYQKNQFTSMTNGRADRCYVKDDIRQLVLEEISNRTNNKVLYFRAGRYHSFGVPLFKEGNHYFSMD